MSLIDLESKRNRIKQPDVNQKARVFVIVRWYFRVWIAKIVVQAVGELSAWYYAAFLESVHVPVTYQPAWRVLTKFSHFEILAPVNHLSIFRFTLHIVLQEYFVLWMFQNIRWWELNATTDHCRLAKMHGYACQDLAKTLVRSYQDYHYHAWSWQGYQASYQGNQGFPIFLVFVKSVFNPKVKKISGLTSLC